MSRRPPLAIFACSSLLVLAACGGEGPTAPSPTPAPAMGVVSLTNHANTPIVTVNIAPCADEAWGANRLDAGQTILPGGTRTWSVAPGCYDVRASTGAKSGMWWDHAVQAGKTVKLALSSAANSVVRPLHDAVLK